MKTFSKAELIEDFDFMIKTLEEVHPNIYSMVDKDVVIQKIEKIRASFSDEMTIIDYHNMVGKLVASFKDGHTYMYLFNDYLYQEKDFEFFYPVLQFKELQAKFMHNIENVCESGDELLAINGIPMDQIVRKMLEYNSAETNAFRYVMLTNKYQLLLYFLFNIQSPYKIKIKRNENIFETTFEGKSISFFENQHTQNKNTQKNISNDSYLKEEFKIENGIGIFTIKTFSYHNDKADSFKKFIDDAFAEMKSENIRNLIFDVRQNLGGSSSMANYITNYLSKEPTYCFDKLIWKSSQQIRDYVLDDVTNTQGSYDQETYDKLLTVGLGECLTQDCKSYKNPNDVNKTFMGNVYVLSDEACFSTTSDFISIIKDLNLGKVIGQNPGGLPNTYGDCYYFDLPNTQIKLSVSHKYFIRPSGNEHDNDLTPDFIVSQTDEDRVNKIDTVMEFAKNLCLG